MLPLVQIEGRVAEDPELRFSQAGKPVGKMRVVSSSRKKNDAGEWVDDKTCWLTVSYFGDMAEHCAESLRKGDLVVITGRLVTDEWTNQEGQKRSATGVIADSIGPSLRFRTVRHSETERSRAPQTSDPWATPSTDDAPPF